MATHLQVDVTTRVAQHVLFGLKVLEGVAIQAEEPLVPLLVQQAGQPRPRMLTILVQVATHPQLVAVR